MDSGVYLYSALYIWRVLCWEYGIIGLGGNMKIICEKCGKQRKPWYENISGTCVSIHIAGGYVQIRGEVKPYGLLCYKCLNEIIEHILGIGEKIC